mgnify:CR=1 FL=1
MELKWKYLTAPLGRHWADKYIDFEFLDTLYTKGHRFFGGKGKKRWFPQVDNGLGDFRFQTASGNLRPLLSSSLKIEKSDGSAVFVRVLYLY